MASLAQGCMSDVLVREIGRFMKAAAKRGESDLYNNRRGATRFHRSWPLFVTRLGGSENEDISVTLDNISSGGLAFHCDEPFGVGALIGVKLFWSDPHSLWIPAQVRHQQITQQGFLVGASFEVHDPTLHRLVEERIGSTWYC